MKTIVLILFLVGACTSKTFLSGTLVTITDQGKFEGCTAMLGEPLVFGYYLINNVECKTATSGFLLKDPALIQIGRLKALWFQTSPYHYTPVMGNGAPCNYAKYFYEDGNFKAICARCGGESRWEGYLCDSCRNETRSADK